MIPINHEFVSGHLPFWLCQQLDKEFDQAFKFTVLRDPIDRFLSLLRYKKKHNPQFWSMDLDSVFQIVVQEDNFESEQKNDIMNISMCHFLAYEPALSGEDLLNSAKKTLDSLDFVLFFDNLEQDAKELFEMIRIEWNADLLPHVNTTQQEEINQKLIEKIKTINKLDIELYEYAKKNKKHKKSTYSFSSPAYQNLLQKKDNIDYAFCMPLKGYGWCFRENVDRFSEEFPIYRWVMDKPAKIYFNLESNHNYIMEFTAQSLIHLIHPRVLINGKEIVTTRFDNMPFSKYKCYIPQNLISNQETEITFFSPYAFQYNHIYPGNADTRKLSFAINGIHIIRTDE
jgi:hypothetical protein